MQISYNPKERALVTRIFSAKSDEELQAAMRREATAARDRGETVIKQAVLDPELPCPCDSGRKTKNCCLKRYRSIMANAGLPVPPDDFTAPVRNALELRGARGRIED